MSAITSFPSSSNVSSPVVRGLRRLIATDGDVGATIARVGLGLVMLPHGLQKAFGWFGGYGFAGTMGFMTQQLGIPAPLALLAILTEVVGALALVVGLGSRLAAFAVAAVMVVATLTVHVGNGFFMNWSGAQAGEGFEYHLLALALAAVVLVKGGGRASVDARLTARGAR